MAKMLFQGEGCEAERGYALLEKDVRTRAYDYGI